MIDDKKEQKPEKVILHLAEIPKDLTAKQRRKLAEKMVDALLGNVENHHSQ